MNDVKKSQIEFCLERVTSILRYLNYDKKWTIEYTNENGEYFYVYDERHFLLYKIDVTADSVLTALYELIHKLAMKF